MTSTAGPRATLGWLRGAEPSARRALFAAGAGWMLDAMDVMLYSFALTAIKLEFGLTSAQAGGLASATLVFSAIGGIAAGVLADRIGRARALIVAVLVYSLATAGTATAQSVVQLLFWRALVGLGLGGEWSAGSVLVAETWPAEHRGKAIGLMQSGWAIGYLLAALLAGTMMESVGWRGLFLIGVLPAFFTLWIRRAVEEPEIWRRQRHEPGERRGLGDLFRPPLARRTVLATLLATTLLFAYWGLFTWIPTYLASPVEKGGAGLSLLRSTAWIVPLQVGAFLGYILFGILADRFGRRPVFLAFVLAAAAIVPAYGLAARSAGVLFVLGPLVGFFGHGYFSVFGALLAEMFPSSLRGTAQGLCYNAGRAASALAPVAIGALADRYGLGAALASTAGLYVLGGLLMFTLPETRGETLQ
jgi:MFS family permease